MFYHEILLLNNAQSYIRFASNYALEKISELLQAKGVNPEVAIVRAKEVFGEESEKASLYLHNLQHCFNTETMQKVYDFISHKALLREAIQFSSYDSLLGMLQHVSVSPLSEPELKQIKRISQANAYAIALVR